MGRVVAHLERSRERGQKIFTYLPHFYSSGRVPGCEMSMLNLVCSYLSSIFNNSNVRMS